MIDLWVAVALTTIVTILTIGADWLASKLIVGAKTIRSIQRILKAGLSASDAYRRIRAELERHMSIQAGALSWGSDLATVAIAMDFAALGVWIHTPSMFPFFSRLNVGSTSREIPIWLIVIGCHAILLVVSLVLKHNHGEIVGRLAPDDLLGKTWLARNRWMLGANFVGFFSLLTSIVVFTNAL